METDPPAEVDFCLGIDVGGTDVKVGLFDPAGHVWARNRSATPGLGTPERVFRHALAFATHRLADPQFPSGRLRAVGLAVPGVLDSREFVLREVVNLPGWLGVPLRERLQAESELPCVVVNDANAAAFAEHALRGLGNSSLALVTLGTGIGCGVVVRGHPYGGDHGCAGELGHIAIDFSPQALPCTCGSRGHLETYAGAAGVVARLRSRLAVAAPGSFPAHLGSDRVTPRDLAEAAESGDELCLEVIRETARHVGAAIGLLGQTLDPAVVLLGGAMTFGGSATASGRSFLEKVRESVRATTLVQVGGNMTIEFASLGNDAGMLGAAMFANQALKG